MVPQTAGRQPVNSGTSGKAAPPLGRMLAHILLGLGAFAYPADYAYTFYKLSAAAYCIGVQGWDCAPCRASNQTVSSMMLLYNQTTDTRVFVAAYKDKHTGDDNIVVSFRGTETVLNWWENLKFVKTDRDMSCAGCKVHSGFLDSWTPVQHKVLVEIRRLKKLFPQAKLYTTGHSLGGALAVIAAYVLEYDLGQNIDGVYTYGSPRVGNDKFAAFYNSGISNRRVTWRVTHHRDPVPHVPLKIMGFQHVATEVFYNANSSSYQVCDGSGEDPACMDSLYGVDVSDHLDYFGETIGEDGCND